VERELSSQRSERAWRAATTEAHRELVDQIESDGSGAVTLGLNRLIVSVARDLGVAVPALPARVGRVTIVAGDQARGARAAARRLEHAAGVAARPRYL
jgi:hypothetical protein